MLVSSLFGVVLVNCVYEFFFLNKTETNVVHVIVYNRTLVLYELFAYVQACHRVQRVPLLADDNFSYLYLPLIWLQHILFKLFNIYLVCLFFFFAELPTTLF